MPDGLVLIRYLDHLLFRGVDHRKQNPIERETVGWIAKQNEAAVWLLWDRATSHAPQERSEPQECGLVILRKDILEVRSIA
jgi:hypothetical protein